MRRRRSLITLATTPDPEDLPINGMGQVRLRATDALPVDRYRDCKPTGAFLLCDGGHSMVGA